MNMFKSNGGFTLVELIVVIAILAILAGVAVPAYSGYIAKANKASDDAQLVVIEQAIGATCAMNGVVPSDAKVSVTLGTTGVTAFTIDGKDVKTTYEEFYKGNAALDLDYYTGVTFDGGVIKTTPEA